MKRQHSAPPRAVTRAVKRMRRPSLATSWAMLFDDPPAMCCTDEQMCVACALDLGQGPSHAESLSVNA